MRSIFAAILYIVFMSLIMSCTAEETANRDGKKVIYQVLPRYFGNTQTANIPYGTIKQNGVGKFNDFSIEALKGIKELGTTHIWYTGVLEHATLSDFRDHGIPLDDADVVKGRAGSPYAIKDYYDVNPYLAVDIDNRLDEFQQLIQRTHDAGMKVIIDFVPNHVARSYGSDVYPERDFGKGDDTSLFYHHNNNFYYIQGDTFKVPENYHSLGEHTHPTKDGYFEEFPAKATGNNVFKAQPSIWDWFETVKLNYGVDYSNNNDQQFDPIPDTWLKMKDILLYWAQKGIDGFRCDMAEMVPVEFWHWVITTVKKEYAEVFFIAEIYNPDQYANYIDNGGFDYLYDKVQTYDTLKNIIRGEGSTHWINGTLFWLGDRNRNMLRFLENHDEQRIASPFFANDAEKALPAATISALVTGGPWMVYFGQETGETGADEEGFSGKDGRTTIFDYWGVPSYQRWVNEHKFDGDKLTEKEQRIRTYYAKLGGLCQKEIFEHGSVHDLMHENVDTQIYFFGREYKEEHILGIINFGGESRDIPLDLPDEWLPDADNELMELYAFELFEREGKQWMKVDPYSSYLFRLY